MIAHPLGKGHHAFKVGRDDFAGAKAALTAAGVESAAPIDWGDHDCMYFLDPTAICSSWSVTVETRGRRSRSDFNGTRRVRTSPAKQAV